MPTHHRLLAAWLVLTIVGAVVVRAGGQDVPRYGIYEGAWTHAGSISNPYTDITASATVTLPGGGTKTVGLFWDGDSTWRMRFSPDQLGQYSFTISSNNAGLNGKSGSFSAVASQNKGGIQAMAGAPYHFQYQDGTPFWWMGDTCWPMYVNDSAEAFNRTSVQQLIDARAAQGFNVIHAQLLQSRNLSNDGGKPFASLAAQTLNPAYWQEVDQRLAYLNGKGVTGGLMLAWANGNPAWDDFANDDARLQFARYVAARYSAYNVYFIVSGEYNEANSLSTYQAIGQQLHSADPHERLVAIHGTGSVKSFADEAWMSFGDYQQLYNKLHQNILDARGKNKPVVNSEYAYFLRDQDSDGLIDKKNSATINDIRHATWDIVMAGGYFITGFGTTYYGGYRDPGPFDLNTPKNDPWEEQVRHVKALFASLEFWRLDPHDELITPPVARGSDTSTPDPSSVPVESYIRPPLRTAWALAEPGVQYLVYVRGHQGEYVLTLPAELQEYGLQLYDPRTGQFSDLPGFTGSGSLTLTAPDGQDWLFLVQQVPEPTSAGLLGAGVLAALRRRKR